MATTLGFLNAYPREIRNEIYKHLLINPYLTDPECLQAMYDDTDYTIGLGPEILRTNRQIYNEAIHYLYDCNNFIVGFVEHTLLTPLMRNHGIKSCHARGQYQTYGDFLRCLSQAHRVRHWTLVVQNMIIPTTIHPSISANLSYFCRAICGSSPKTLTVLIVPKELTVIPEDYGGIQVWHVEEDMNSLKPLEILRNVGKLEFRPVGEQDSKIWDYHTAGFTEEELQRAPFQTSLNVQNLQNALALNTPLIEGTTEAPLVFLMNEKLQRYARAFERCPQFKWQMSMPYVGRQTEQDLEDWLTLGFTNTKTDLRTSQSPFTERFHRMHPLEHALHCAEDASTQNAEIAFKLHRTTILNYLEPQYGRIVAAADGLRRFVIQQTDIEGILVRTNNKDYVAALQDEVFGVGVMILKRYMEALERDVPLAIKTRLALKSKWYNLHYEKLNSEKLMKELENLVESDKLSGQFIRAFKRAADRIEMHRHEIQAARKALFDSDSFEGGRWDEEDTRSFGDVLDWKIEDSTMIFADCYERGMAWENITEEDLVAMLE